MFQVKKLTEFRCNSCKRKAQVEVGCGLPSGWRKVADDPRPWYVVATDIITGKTPCHAKHVCAKCQRTRPAASPINAAALLKDRLEEEPGIKQVTWRMPLDSDIPRLVVFASEPIDYPEEYLGYAVDVYTRPANALVGW